MSKAAPLGYCTCFPFESDLVRFLLIGDLEITASTTPRDEGIYMNLPPNFYGDPNSLFIS